MRPIKTNKLENTYSPCKGDYAHVFPTTIFQGQVNLNHNDVAHHCRSIVSSLPKGDSLTEYTTYFHPDAREVTHNQPWYNDFANQMKKLSTTLQFRGSAAFEKLVRDDFTESGKAIKSVGLGAN